MALARAETARARRPEDAVVRGRDPSPPAPEVLLLALQRSAGNHAVARMLSASGRRGVARSSTADDIEQQQADDEADIMELLSRVALPEPTPMQVETEALAEASPPMVSVPMVPARSGPVAHEQSGALVGEESGMFPTADDIESDVPELVEEDELSYYGSDIETPPPGDVSEEEETESEELEAPEELEEIGGRAPFRRGHVYGGRSSPYGLPSKAERQRARKERLYGSERAELRPKRVLSPKMTAPAAAHVKTVNKVWTAANYAAEGLVKGTQGAATPTNRDISATGVGQYAKAKKWAKKGGGSNTVQKVRPPDWPVFRLLLGYLGKASPCPYVMGHLLHRDFGGTGREMYNLTPFSHSLNGNHYNSVEDVLLGYVDPAPVGTERAVDYKVLPNYGGSPKIDGEVHTRFDQHVNANLNAVLTALGNAGVQAAVPAAATVTAADQLHIKANPGLFTANAVVALPSGVQWNLVLDAVRLWLTTYVNQHFPTGIDCTARFYSRPTGVAAPWEKWPTQSETITQ